MRIHRYWAAPVVALCLVAIVVLNWGAAHFREVAATVDDFGEKMVIEHMARAPFDLGPTSWMLGLLGIMCAVLAARKGYTSSDFPGYEPADRNANDKAAAADDLTASLKGELGGNTQAEIEELANGGRSGRAAIDDLERRMPALLIAAERAKRLDDGDFEAVKAAIERARNIHRAVRADGAESRAYTAPIEIERPKPLFDPAELTSLIEAAAAAHATRQAAIDAAVTTEIERVRRVIGATERIMMVIEANTVRDEDVAGLTLDDLVGVATPKKLTK